MNKFFYQKLAITNLKNNRQTYIPYIITCIGTIIMFYNMCNLTFHSSTKESGSLTSMMILGVFVTGIFSMIFLFYTNSFLVKRRKKEFGVFNILGMEKKHIGRIVFWENLIVAIISIVVGILLGIVLSNLMTLLLYKILRFDPDFTFEINILSIIISISLFVGIFAIIVISNWIQIQFINTIGLLKGSNVGEREPKAKWLITIIGILCIGIGYFISISLEEPLGAVGIFFYAAVLVIIGTYCLFTSGSIVILKSIKKNKKLYYKTPYFISTSGMIYRMKQNAVGLANICILSTIVLVLLSTTTSLYAGVENILQNSFPTDIEITTRYIPKDNVDKVGLQNRIKEVCSSNNVNIDNYNIKDFMDYGCNREGNKFIKGDTPFVSMSNSAVITVITNEEYKRITNESIQLNDNEILFYNEDKSINNNIIFLDKEYEVKKRLEESPVEFLKEYDLWKADLSCIVVANDEEMNNICSVLYEFYGEYSGKVKYSISFDINNIDEVQFMKKLQNNLGDDFKVISREAKIPEFYEMYGSLLFLGIFLGVLFLIGTVLIIYYKQIIEGFDDKERYKIMKRVGMSKEEIGKSIKTQIFIVFTLPILVACIHLVAAFPIMIKMLNLLGLNNKPLFIICTLITAIIFIIAYLIVYVLTSRVYRKIVN